MDESNVIDFEDKKASMALIKKEIEAFHRDIDDFTHIIYKTCHVRILDEGKIRKLQCLAYAMDTDGVVLRHTCRKKGRFLWKKCADSITNIKPFSALTKLCRSNQSR